MNQWRVVLDTNLLIAAARSRTGASSTLLRALLEQRFIALVSVPLMLEYEAVLNRDEHLVASGRTVHTNMAFLDTLCLFAEPVHLHYLWRPQLRDPADEMVLETALNGHANALVTLNTADFAAAANFRLPVFTPGRFLHRLSRENL